MPPERTLTFDDLLLVDDDDDDDDADDLTVVDVADCLTTLVDVDVALLPENEALELLEYEYVELDVEVLPQVITAEPPPPV